MEFTKIRTRFAPSPTGYLHIGSARTALFNYLIAKKFGGSFIFRIEDTDISRNIEDSTIELYNDLKWLGINPDESIFDKNINGEDYGPYRQTERLKIYQDYVNFLLNNKFSYFCFCSQDDIENERNLFFSLNKRKNYQYSRKCLKLNDDHVKAFLKENRKYVVRVKVDNFKEYFFSDIVREKVSFSGIDIEDFIIVKENGIPTYNFSCVIDDYLMKITHVLRGDEHISNTGKQIILYDFFGWVPPLFGHLSSIINEETGKKISKRDSDREFQLISKLREFGYLPESIINYLIFLGWYPKTKVENKEIFHIGEILKIFELNGFHSSPASYSLKKLNWYNRWYIQNIDIDLFHRISWIFLKKNFDLKEDERIYSHMVSDLFRPQINNFQELVPLSSSFFDLSLPLFKFEKNDYQIIKSFFSFVNGIEFWEENEIDKVLSDILHVFKKSKKYVYHLFRKIFTNQDHGPGLVKTMYVLGKNRIIKRLKNII